NGPNFAATETLALGQTSIAGDLLIAVVQANTNTGSCANVGFTTPPTATWVEAGVGSFYASGTSPCLYTAVWYCANCIATSTVVFADAHASSENGVLSEWSGAAASPLDTTATW